MRIKEGKRKDKKGGKEITMSEGRREAKRKGDK